MNITLNSVQEQHFKVVTVDSGQILPIKQTWASVVSITGFVYQLYMRNQRKIGEDLFSEHSINTIKQKGDLTLALKKKIELFVA